MLYDSLPAALYSWSMAEFRRERAGHFARVARVSRPLAQKLGTWFAECASHEADLLEAALVRRFHKRAAMQCGDLMTAEHLRVLQLWEDYRDDFDRANLRYSGPGIPIERSGVPRTLRVLIVNHLSECTSMGVRQDIVGPRWVTQLFGWTLETCVEFPGGRMGGVAYRHCLTDSVSRAKEPALSLLAWLGLSSETSWHPHSKPEAEEVAACIREFAEYFISALPTLANGNGIRT